MTTANVFRRLLEVLPSDPLLVGDVTSVESDGTAVVTLPGGGQLRVRNPLASGLDARVFVQGGAITGPAPALPFVDIQIS